MEEFELALDDCLEKLASGKLSVAQCLARYPKYASALRPLLETALQLQQGKRVRPSGATRDRARAELAGHQEAYPRKRQRSRGIIPTPVTGLLVLVLAAFCAGSAFAQEALPGQLLYSLKLSTEQAWRAASPNPIRADLALVGRRTNELIQLSKESSAQGRQLSSMGGAELEGLAAYRAVLARLSSQTDGPEGNEILAALQARQSDLSQAGIHLAELDDILAHGHADKDKGHSSPNVP
jgi:hypothetical protein